MKTFLLTEEIARQKNLMGIKEPPQPVEISKEEAEKLLNTTDNFIYIQTKPNSPLDSWSNTFAINSKIKDASLNMYMQRMTPREIGLDAIIDWLKERGVAEPQFFTLYSDEPKSFEDGQVYGGGKSY